jgi:hypothetical protein
LYLTNLGYQSFCLGNSRAFLNDGVLQYKKKWNLRLIKAKGFSKIQNFIFKPGIIVKIPILSESAKSFLVTNPFIFEHRGLMNVAVFVENSSTLSPKARKTLFKRNNIKGVCKICVYDVEEIKSREVLF